MQKPEYMLIRTDNIPTDLSCEYKIMEGSKETMEEICNILNGVEPSNENSLWETLENPQNTPYYYIVKRVDEELYDGYEAVYGYDEGLNLKEKFEKDKYGIEYKGGMYYCDLNSLEARRLFVGY